MRIRKLPVWFCLVLWASLGLCALAQSGATKNAAKKKTAGTAGKSKSSGAKTSSKSASTGKSAPKKGATNSGSSSASKKGVSKSGSKTASKRGKKGAPKTTWRNRQLAPTPERYKQIQEALVAKGYLNAEDANGQWGQSSVAALKSFQAAQNLESTGKINSLSLIALGLGPKRETLPAGPKPAEPPPPPTAPTQP